MKKSAGYVDGFILPVKKSKLAVYKKWAKLSAKVWLEHGAIQYMEAVGDDVPKGKVTSFGKSVKLKAGEIVVFSWVTYKSRKDRDRIMQKVMNDPRMASLAEGDEMPFDGMRMFWGGFKPLVQA